MNILGKIGKMLNLSGGPCTIEPMLLKTCVNC